MKVTPLTALILGGKTELAGRLQYGQSNFKPMRGPLSMSGSLIRYRQQQSNAYGGHDIRQGRY